MLLRFHARVVLTLLAAYIGLSALPAFYAQVYGVTQSAPGLELCVHDAVGIVLPRAVRSEVRRAQPTLAEGAASVVATCPSVPAFPVAADKATPGRVTSAAILFEPSGFTTRPLSTARARGPPLV